MKKLFLPLSMLLTATSLWGIDVYFYSDSDTAPEVHSSIAVRSIELGTEQTVVNRMDFTSTPIDNKEFSHMLFRPKELSGAEITREARTGISVTLSANTLTVAAPASIDLLELTAANGIRVASVSSPASTLSYSLEGLAQGIYVVRVQAGDIVSVTKLIKK